MKVEKPPRSPKPAKPPKAEKPARNQAGSKRSKRGQPPVTVDALAAADDPLAMAAISMEI